MTPSAQPPPGLPASLAELFPEASFAAKIGEGAYGKVWLARFPGGAWRAVKYVAGDSESAQRERRALRLLRSLADPAAPDAPLHPALLPVADLRESPGAFAYSMPLADSLRPNWRDDPAQYRPRSLDAELVARRALPLDECLGLAETLAGALAFLQRHCLVHRDLKPSNVLFLDGRPVLADFGLLADTREAGSCVGTPGYVPPEQHGDFSADLYSLGILLRVASTGRPAKEAGLAPVPEADTSHPLVASWLDLLRRCTDASPRRRPQTAEAFLKDLQDLRALPAAARRCRPRLLYALLALALLALIAAALRGIRRTAPPPPAPAPAPEIQPPAPVPPSDSRPLFVSGDMAEDGAFLQLFTDRIRVGLPLHGYAAEDAALLLVLPPGDPAYDPGAVWKGPFPWRLCPLVPADASNTPPSAAEAPAWPADASRTGRLAATAIVPLPAGAPYPEAVFLLCESPQAWQSHLAALPAEAPFETLRDLWWNACEAPRALRESSLVQDSGTKSAGEFMDP